VDRRGEAVLAQQVAAVLPVHRDLPDATVGALTRIVDRLGDERALLDWLGRYSGRPRLVAAVYGLIGLLDQVVDHPAVVAALQETRMRPGPPSELEAPPAPETGSLASLGGQLESMLAEGRLADAVETATATVDLLRQVLARAAGTDPDLAGLTGQLDRVRHHLDTVGRIG
jgi:hypothetical protein